MISNRWMEHDLEKQLTCIRDFVWQHAGEQMNLAELYLRARLGGSIDFDAAHAEIQKIEAELDERLEYGFADRCRSAYMSYAGTLAMETYLRGVMDGARLYYAIVGSNLPTDGE